MKVIVDTNMIIAALIKDGGSRAVFRNPAYQFFTPDFAFDEIWKYRNEIADRANLSEGELSIFIFLLTYRIKILSNETYKENISEAISLVGKIDRKDVPFIAAALALDAVLWTHDKYLANQKKVKIVTTKNLL